MYAAHHGWAHEYLEIGDQMGEIAVSALHTLAAAALEGQGLAAEDARNVSEEFVVAEVAGIRTHGVGKLVSMNLGDLSASPIVQQYGALLNVDGCGGSGLLLMRDVATRLVDISTELGVGMASVRNFSRYSSLYPYTEHIAHHGHAAILMNSAGPAATTPFGSADPITGTNPICFSFPTAASIQTFDLATSEIVWGEIRQAAFEDRPVPYGPFLDSAGDITTVPAEVNAVKSFGGAKGFALNLAIEIIAGLLTGSPAGLDVKTEYDCGAVLLAINPSVSGAKPTFPDLVSRLLEEIRTSRPLEGHVVRAPGDRGRSRVSLAEIASQTLEVPDTIIALLSRMAKGEKIAELSSNPLFN